MQLKRSYINGSPINVWVLSDRTELEALLWPWLWLLKCDPAVEILARRIIAATPLASAQIASGNGMNMNLKLWLNDETISFSEDELQLDMFGDASTLFTGDEVLGRSHAKEDLF